MKNLIVLLITLIMSVSWVFAQNPILTDREILMEISRQQARQGEQIAELVKQMAENNKQITELTKQTAINSTDIKAIDKRFDILFYLMLGMLAGIFGLIGTIFWDRRAANAQLEAKTAALEVKNLEFTKEIDALKERETKLENNFKKILEKFPDLANLA